MKQDDQEVDILEDLKEFLNKRLDNFIKIDINEDNK